MKYTYTLKNLFAIITFLSCFIVFNANAQKSRIAKPSKTKVTELKIAYLTKEVDLTEKEAEKFWPVYNLHEKKLQENKTNLRETKREETNAETDSAKEKMMMQRMKLESEKAEIKKKRHSALKNVLSSTKISKVYAAEEGFIKYMFRQYKGRK